MADPGSEEKDSSLVRQAEPQFAEPQPRLTDGHGDEHKSARAKLVCPTCASEFHGFADTACPNDGAELQLVDTLIGTCFAGRYQILELLGRGGMSVVYKAQHLFMDKTVAVKILHSHLEMQSVAVRRFQLESKAAGALSHASIVSVHDFGLTEDGRMFLIMDCVEGQSLSDEITENGPVAPATMIPWILDILDALEHAHSKGVVHRDLKPSNLVLSIDDAGLKKPKIVDFGIAKLTGKDEGQIQHLTTTGEIFGSPLYMSPEQCRGKQLDGRTDIYAMGCVMYEALTGAPPLVGDNALVTLNMHISTTPASMRSSQPDIPLWLDEVVLKALEKEPKDRFQSAAEFKEVILDGVESGASSNMTGYQALASRLGRRSKKFSKVLRVPIMTALATIVFVAAVAGIAYITNESFRKTIDYPIKNLQYSMRYDNGQKLISQGKFAEAIKEFRAAGKVANTSQQRWQALDRLAFAYDGTGQYIQADKTKRKMRPLRALVVSEGLGLSEHEFNQIKSSLANMPDPKNSEQASVQIGVMTDEAYEAISKQGDFEYSRKLFVRALTLRERWYPDTYPEILALKVSIGTADAMSGKVKEAEREWLDAKAYQQNFKMPLDQSSVFIPQNLARVEQLKGNIPTARMLFTEGLDNAKKLNSKKDLKRAYEEYLGFLRTTKIDEAELALLDAQYKKQFPPR